MLLSAFYQWLTVAEFQIVSMQIFGINFYFLTNGFPLFHNPAMIKTIGYTLSNNTSSYWWWCSYIKKLPPEIY